jgi:predicted site-specific integrase-resolvase
LRFEFFSSLIFVFSISRFCIFYFSKKVFQRERSRRAIWHTLPAHSDLRREQRYGLHDLSSLDRRTAPLKSDLDYLRKVLAIPDSDSTTGRLYGIDSRCMVLDATTPTQVNHSAAVGSNAGTIETAKRRPRAVLYARVSTDLQQKEGTIESQVVTLRRQIMAAGQELVREYIDDGCTGTLLMRPGLEQLRSDLKTDLFDVVHFLAADRIARRAAYQSIIIEELIKAGKQIIINGSDYRNDPELWWLGLCRQ